MYKFDKNNVSLTEAVHLDKTQVLLNT